MQRLTNKQQAAVLYMEGDSAILAGAGSGKTFVIVEKAATLVEKLHVPPEKILIVTFTDKAAAEMEADRCQGGPEDEDDAGRRGRETNVGIIAAVPQLDRHQAEPQHDRGQHQSKAEHRKPVAGKHSEHGTTRSGRLLSSLACFALSHALRLSRARAESNGTAAASRRSILFPFSL